MKIALVTSLIASSLLVAGCTEAVDDDGDDVSESSLAAPAPLCRLGPYSPESSTTPLPRGDAQTQSMQVRVDEANARARARGDETRYTLEDFGPYAHFDVGLEGSADRDVRAKISVRHTMPNGQTVPPTVVWRGTIPRGVSGPLMFEMYYDAEQFGLGPKSPRYGTNRGVVEAECEGTVAKQAYSFLRRAPR